MDTLSAASSPACGAAITPPCSMRVHANGLCEGHNRRRLRGLVVDVPLGRKAPKAAVPLGALNVRIEVDVIARLKASAGERGESTSDELLADLGVHHASEDAPS